MKIRTLLLPTLLATATLVPQAQENARGQDELRPGERSMVPAPKAGPFAPEEAARRLRDEDLEVRRRAYEDLLARAAHEPSVREALRAWATSDDRELAWTAELLLRELDLRRAGPFDSSGWPGGGLRGPRAFGGLEQRQRDLMRRFEELLQNPFSSGPAPDPFGKDGFFGGAPFQGLDDLRSEGFRMELGPDGVRVEIREGEDGEESVHTYEAGSMEELLETNPELRDRLQPRRVLPGRPFAWGTPDPMPFGGRGVPPFGRPGGAPRTDVLGVEVVPAAPGAAGMQEVEPGVGLTVLRVFRGTLAEHLGVRAGEILLELNGTPIRGVQDVKRVLAERGEEEGLSLESLSANGVRQTRHWSPAAVDGADADESYVF